MRTILVLSLTLSCALAQVEKDDAVRIKKSQSYGVPCAAGLADHLQPIALYMAPQGQLPQHYREEEEQMMQAADTSARSYYESPAHASSALSGIGTALGAYNTGSSSSGSAVGLFPNARVGACAIPLLLSCSPSVVSGHIAKANSYPAYRMHEEDLNMREVMEQDWAREGGHDNQLLHHHHELHHHEMPHNHVGLPHHHHEVIHTMSRELSDSSTKMDTGAPRSMHVNNHN